MSSYTSPEFVEYLRSSGTQLGSDTSLTGLLSLAKDYFLSVETHDPSMPEHPMHEELKEGTTLQFAVFDVAYYLYEFGFPVDQILKVLIQETKANPYAVDFEGFSIEDWQEIYPFMISEILKQELPLKFPELIEENKRREKIKSNSKKAAL